MEFTPEEIATQTEACKYIVDHKNELIEKFILSKKPLRVGFASIFMAGSPGAGKTEFSRRYIPLLVKELNPEMTISLQKMGVDTDTAESLMVVIDVDEIREFLPQYHKADAAKGIKANAHVIQKAANKGLDILREYCFANEISFLHDGTFANYKTVKELIQKSIKNDREVALFYLYIDPLAAWEFTKARERVEGRNILKENFIDQYINSLINVIAIKKEFGNQVKVNCVIKNSSNEVISIEFNVSDIERFLKTQYQKGTLIEYSREDLLKQIN